MKLQLIVLKVGIGVLKLQFVDSKLENAVWKLEDAVLKLENAVLKLQNTLLKLPNALSSGSHCRSVSVIHSSKHVSSLFSGRAVIEPLRHPPVGRAGIG